MTIHDPVKVLVVDDHLGIRKGISSLIDAEWPHMCSVGSAATCAQALELARQTQPHVVVLDVNLDGEDGLLLIAALQRVTHCQVVVLTSLADPHVAAHARRLGASACVHKTAPAADLLVCILAARPAADRAVAATPLIAGGSLSYLAGSNHP
jgi:two-component system, NarL family, nitrate/nitrite response regulator NarL